MISEIIKVVFFLGIAFYIDFDLTLGVMVVTPILVITVRRYAKRLKRSGRQRQEALDGLNSKLQETLSGIRIIRAFATEEYEINNFKKKNNSLKKIAVRSARYNAKANSIMEALNYIIIALLLMFSGYRVLRAKNFTPGDFITIIGAISSMYTPAKRAMTRFNAISVNLSSITRVSEILEEIPNIVNRPNCIKFENFLNDINFENVDFGYNESKIILHDINLYAKPGEKIAFVGATGAGKTTITNLINRFYDIQNGKIRYDGINIQKINKSDLRKSLGIVLQDTHLFSGTVADNIRYGKLDATDEEVRAAAKLANAHHFIKHLPKGYDTYLSNGGANLSQGQRQLLSIARAAIADPPVLILDEATSSIDTRTEKIVQEGMDKLMKGRTVFVIAHRLSTIRNSDVIMVLEQGRIIERGNHDELLKQKGTYYQLYTGGFELD